jgi:type I restriction enzyme S subunit
MSEEKLPRGWSSLPLEDISDFVIGGDWGVDPESEINGDYSLVACIRGSEIKNWRVDKGKTASLRLIKQSSLEKRQLRLGDLLIEISGGGPDQPVGRVILIDEEALAQNAELPKIGTNFLRLIRLVDSVNCSFVNYYLQKFYITGKIVEYQGGSNNLRNLKYKEFSKIEIPLPALPEQHRIVAKLDAVFGHLDRIEARFESMKKLKDRLIDAFLTDTQTGKFFIPRILKNFIEEGTERIGEDWPNKFKVGVSAREGVIELETGQKSSFENYKIVRPGDFVYNAMRVNIGSIVQYRGKEIGITSPDYIVFRIKHSLSPKLLLNWLKSENGILQINSNTKGSVRSRLYFKNLANINYPIAPDKTQIQAEKILKWYQNLESYQTKKLSRQISELRQSILAKAFRGELVGQEVNEYGLMESEVRMVAEGLEKYRKE